MSKHPYPQKIVDEIADYLKPYTASRIEAGSLAHQVLNALWEADQPHTLSANEASTIWSDVVNARHGSVEAMHRLRTRLVEHAPDWGKAQ